MAKLHSPKEVLEAQKARISEAAASIINTLLEKHFSPTEKRLRISLADLKDAFKKGGVDMPNVNAIIKMLNASGWRAELKSPAHFGEDSFHGIQLSPRS